MSGKKHKESACLSASDRRRAGVCPGGKWFRRKEQAKAYANETHGPGLGFVGAWPYTGNGYCYGVYDNYEDFLTNILKLAVGRRYGFEMIRSENRCNLYFDIEGILKNAGDEEGVIARLIAAIRKILWKKYRRIFGLHITRSSRQTDKGFKLSYHIVVTGCLLQMFNR